MRYIKFFNENNNIEIDEEYLNDCFIEFIDDGAEVIINEEDYWSISIYFPGFEYKGEWRRTSESPSNTKEHIEILSKKLDIFKNIETCIKKVKLKYPNIEIGEEIGKEEISNDDNIGDYDDVYYSIYIMLT